MTQPARRKATLEEFWAIPEQQRFHELIGGELIEKAAPSGEHSEAQGAMLEALRPSYSRSSGGGGAPGGWWLLPEVEVLLDGQIVRPDITGFRRERYPGRPTGTPLEVRPDWVCEVLSESNATNDTVKKLRLNHRAGIPHYWIVDPTRMTLTVMRWSEQGYIMLQNAERGEVVRAEPFEQRPIAVGTLFGDDPPA